VAGLLRSTTTDQFGRGAPENLERCGPLKAWSRSRSTGKTVCLVWDMTEGYPGAARVRDYHRKTRYTCGLGTWPAGRTGPMPRRCVAREHARDFVAKVGTRLDAYRGRARRRGIVCCRFDTGAARAQWWYEARHGSQR
jgi:predicted glycosyl hydrolase (DUF1957 family)